MDTYEVTQFIELGPMTPWVGTFIVEAESLLFGSDFISFSNNVNGAWQYVAHFPSDTVIRISVNGGIRSSEEAPVAA